MQVMKMSKLYAPTLKEDPVEAELASHRLLLRAGMIRKVAAGVYDYLPLAWRSIRKIERVIREEMDGIGAQEILMPALQPAEFWHESGRWDDYGPELMRLSDRHEREFCLGPTHEEVVTALVRDELKSYRQLPVTLYQIQTKYRDEIRPRFGLLRTREFIMKDAYSFAADEESAKECYDEEYRAYERICDRLGFEWRAVNADSGQIGGNLSTEFMAVAESGEVGILYCDCGYASDDEAAEGTIHVEPCGDHLEKVETPHAGTIEDLANMLGIPQCQTVKTMAGKDVDGTTVLLFIPGDHELNEIKVEKAVPGFTLLEDEEIPARGLVKGFMGPVGAPKDARIIADVSLKESSHWLVGALETNYHYKGAAPGVDFEVDEWADVTTIKPGDACPVCGKPLHGARGIEVGQVFSFGSKYSAPMGATYMDEDGAEKPFVMGSYGIGVSRALASIIEQGNDENGIIWPVCVAPYEVAVLPLALGDDLVEPLATKIADGLAAAGIETVLDDRDERAGVKFNDADLYGWPYQVIVGKRGAKNGEVELKVRATGERENLPADEAVEKICAIVEAERARYTHEAAVKMQAERDAARQA
jgi:prolyl-tRNA synthetase